jgi:2-amino-4-ketopentanoate thiolase alpha subunit
MLIDKGKYVRLRKHVLLPDDRAANIPDDTKKVPLKMWVKGNLIHESELFEEAQVKTTTGRIVKGELKEVEPKYKHSYGDFIEEIYTMKNIILSEMWGNNDEF